MISKAQYLLAELRAKGIRVRMEGGKLLVAPTNLLTSEDREEVRRLSADIRGVLEGR